MAERMERPGRVNDVLHKTFPTLQRIALLLAVLAVTALVAVGCTPPPPILEEKDYVPGDPTRGAVVFQQVCANCHGPEGRGIKDQGSDLTKPDKTKGFSEYDMYVFLRAEKTPPPIKLKGMNDDKIRDGASFARSLRPE